MRSGLRHFHRQYTFPIAFNPWLASGKICGPYSFEEEVNFYLWELIKLKSLEIKSVNGCEYERMEKLYFAIPGNHEN